MARILVVDDYQLFREPVALTLRNAGHVADCASDGEEALRLLEGIQPDLILMDLAMPGMDGLTFLRRLFVDERWAAIPVIVLSAECDGTNGQEALRLGARECLVKGSLSLQELASHVERVATGP
jgi:CheY-like chemotaxis protein